MKTKTRLVVTLTLAFAMLTLGSWTLVQSWPGSTGGPLHRLSADFKNFDQTETFTSVGVFPSSVGSVPGNDGQLVYTKIVSVPDDHNVLYVTMSGTGDTHDGASLWLGCRVDGNDCNPGAGGASGAHPGYISLQKMPAFVATPLGTVGSCNDGGGGFGDCHDNNINYTWCTPIYGGTHQVELRLATSESGKDVFFEASHFYIDSNFIEGNACEQAEPIEDAVVPPIVPPIVPPLP